jgi:hypothetical protein
MFNRQIRLPALVAAPLIVALGVGIAGAVGAVAAASPPALLRCEIETHLTNGMIALEGVVHANTTVAGSYQFRVVSTGASGNSDIEQGGAFAARPEGKATLGRVMLGSGNFDADLEVTVDGATVSCSHHVGGPI